MKWQYKVSLFLLVISQVSFFGLAAYHTDDQLYYPDDNLEGSPTRGYSWIWYHPEQWLVCLVFGLFALVFFIFGFVVDIRNSGLVEN